MSWWKKPAPKPTRFTKDFRLILSSADWTKLREAWWEGHDFLITVGEAGTIIFPKVGRVCWVCSKQITSSEDFTIDHINPRGLGGGTRDDSPENLAPACWGCNADKGSRRVV